MLFFIHIPKSAGTSLRSTVSAALAKRLVEIYQDHPGKTTQHALSRPVPDNAVVFGHFSFGMHALFGAEPCYATALRHPVARVLSLYNYQAGDPRLPLHAATQRSSLPEMLQDPTIDGFRNHMTEIIAGRKVRAPDDMETLERAKRNLAEFVFVSTQETLREDVPLLERALGVQLPRLKRVNVTRKKLATEAHADDILAHNQLDMLLYDFALTLRGRQLAN